MARQGHCPIPRPWELAESGLKAFRAWVSTVHARDDPHHCGACPIYPWDHPHYSYHQSPHHPSSLTEALFHSPNSLSRALAGPPAQFCDLGPQGPGICECIQGKISKRKEVG